jgi:hypothetical protein
MSEEPQLLPVGQRPKCLHCNRELRPTFKREHPPLNVPTGETFTHMETVDFYKGIKEERTVPVTRGMTAAERRQWNKDHPPQFLGTYGG